MQNAYLESESSAAEMAIGLKKDWVFDNVSALRSALDEVDAGDASHVTFQCGGLKDIDIAGAWVLFRKSEDLKAAGRPQTSRVSKPPISSFSITSLE